MFCPTFIFAQRAAMPRIIEKNGRHALMVDDKPFLILGGQAHNSSGWPAMLPAVWSAVNTLHANTLEVPVYWEQIEAQQGKFNFSVVNTLLKQARQHHVRLVLLWFATWKNGSNHYMPAWMKLNPARYPNITGNKGQPVDSPSPGVEATLKADIDAFTALMQYLKKADERHTVIMVQVENEPGAWGSVRDYSTEAQKLFAGPVPAQLLKPALLTQMNVPVVQSGNWQNVFGERADEYFQAWQLAGFIGKVAAAGKKVNPLPIYVNAALRDPLTNPMPNTYESGGATDNVIPIWKAVAPAIDLLAPDIYLDGSERVLKILDLYNRPDNALFVPEAGLVRDNARYCFAAIASGGIGFSPFGIDDNGEGAKEEVLNRRLAPFAGIYATLSPMMRELAAWGFNGKIKAAVEREDHAPQTIDLGKWNVLISFGHVHAGTIKSNTEPDGKFLIAKLNDNRFVVTGTDCHITFNPTGDNSNKAWQYLNVQEGQYENGKFITSRILNGDETDWGGPGFGSNPKVLMITLTTR